MGFQKKKKKQFIQIPTILEMLKENFPNPKILSLTLAGEEISTQTINKMSSIKQNL